ncbi:MAG: hypothetical protein FWE74_00480 [Oscillospiraceae bacterium]|nr:hypothetical protein [Oscillospiraceae bacterium]
MYLYHYYERGRTPFLSLSDLSDEEALTLHKTFEIEGNIFNKRNADGKYMFYRRIVEEQLYSAFVAKGGKPQKKTPFYMVLGECDFCKSWFIESEVIKIPLEEFDKNTVSFTYGDSFPTFDPTTGETQEYRQNVYTYNEIWDIINKYGMPQEKPCDYDVPYFHVHYVEAQVWSDEVINNFRL